MYEHGRGTYYLLLVVQWNSSYSINFHRAHSWAHWEGERHLFSSLFGFRSCKYIVNPPAFDSKCQMFCLIAPRQHMNWLLPPYKFANVQIDPSLQQTQLSVLLQRHSSSDGSMSWVCQNWGDIDKTNLLHGPIQVHQVVLITMRFSWFHQDKHCRWQTLQTEAQWKHFVHKKYLKYDEHCKHTNVCRH